MSPSSRVLPVALAAILLVPLIPVAGAAPLSLAHPGGGVAFTFTGGWASGTAAASTLESHGMRGTFYASSGLLRQGPYYTAYMSATDLADLSSRGHDVESMTVTQVDLTTVDSARLQRELADSQATLQAITGKSVRHLAYPYGGVNAAVASATAGRYASGQTISWSVADFTASVDAYHLPGFLVRKATTLAEAKWIVDYAHANNVIVVLSFGNIVSNPGTYDWTPSNLNALAAYVQSSGTSVSTISQLVTGAPPTPVEGAHGALVFTFDDGSTTHLGAAQTLAARGFRGTFYVISDCPRSEANTDYCMSNEQVVSLARAGHDVESHTVHHRDLTTLNARNLKDELLNSRNDLAGLTGMPVKHIAYPYGSHNPAVRQQVAQYYTTGRIYLNNPAPADLPGLLAQSGSDKMLVAGIGVTAATSLDRAKAYVDYASSHASTIVLVFHDIASPPIDEFSWSPANLAALADYAKTKAVLVETMAQAYP
jgi:peptidoglycan/xylan/chitin deacetylase (PgdA/CDA1 family)